MTSTSEQDVLEQIIESLRSRLERLLQIISHDYELRLDLVRKIVSGKARL